MKKILLLEDNPVDIDLVSREIKNKWPDVDLVVVSRINDAKELLQTDYNFEIAIFDLNLPDGNGMDLLGELRSDQCLIPIIILTGQGSEEIAITALKSGANDFIPKKDNYHKQITSQIEFTLNNNISSRKHINVLYVEHHKSDIDLTVRYFKESSPHIHLTTISTGEELLKILPADNSSVNKFDVVLLDYRLPGLNALEVCKTIRLERNLSIALVIVTGQGDEQIVVEALKIGVDDYIVKQKNYLLRLPSVLMSAYRRKELERQKEELLISETKFRLLADYAADWEYWIDPEGEYVYISPVCEQTSGYPPEAFMKNKNLVSEITHPDFRDSISLHYKEEIERLHKPIEFKIFTAGGEEKWISHFCRPVFDENNIYLGKRGVNRDITERKKSELELIDALERATESDRLKSAFLANMSHEIRTPMNGILGFANLLKQPGLDGAEQQKYLNIIENSGQRMLNTIMDLVNISKIESGLVQVVLSEFNLNEQIESCFNLFKPEIDKKGIELSINKGLSNFNSVIKSDKLKVYSIISNLIANAVKFTHEGSIEFGYNLIQGDVLSGLESEIQFYVKDTGIGIPKDRHLAIFERFVKADIEDKGVYEGSGLGLAISKAFIEILGGKIWLKSTVGQGSEFHFTIQYNTKKDDTSTQKEIIKEISSTKQTLKLKILVVEDEEVVNEYLAVILEDASSDILYAKNGLEAIEIFKENPDIDLILMDIKMSVMNGYEATRKIREINRDVIIIAQTALAMVGDREKSIEAGCNDYITKPIIKEILLAMISKNMKHSS